MRLTRRLAGAVAAAVLVVPLSVAPAAYADGFHDCFGGSIEPAQDGYDIYAQGCSGVGYVDVVVKVWAGTAAGTHRCGSVFPWNSMLGARWCHPEP